MELVGPEMMPGDGTGMYPDLNMVESPPETFLHKIWRFIKGLIGLDSGKTQPDSGDFPQEMPPMEIAPMEGSVKPLG